LPKELELTADFKLADFILAITAKIRQSAKLNSPPI